MRGMRRMRADASRCGSGTATARRCSRSRTLDRASPPRTCRASSTRSSRRNRAGRGGDGLDVLRKVKERHPETEVIVMTAFGSEEVRERALQLGALCYLEKSPRLASEVVPLVQRALEKRELALRGKSLAEDNQLLRDRLEARGRLGDMVGRSAAMQAVFQLVEKVATAPAAARTTVLITGESGGGKGLVAGAVH